MADSDGVHNCRKCGIAIGNHNKYLHDGMCGDCFFSTYAPEERPPLVTDEKTMMETCKANEEENIRFMKLAKSGSFKQEEFDRIVSKIKTCNWY